MLHTQRELFEQLHLSSQFMLYCEVEGEGRGRHLSLARLDC